MKICENLHVPNTKAAFDTVSCGQDGRETQKETAFGPCLIKEKTFPDIMC